MKTPENALANGLRKGDAQFGLWLGSGDARLAEIGARAGFDWCLIDGEHSPTQEAMAENQLRAIALGGAAAAMRVASGEDWLIKRALDLGVQTLVVPMVDSAEEASRIASACRYPPEGHRGMGAIQARATLHGEISDYVAAANDQICLFVQAESRAAVDNIDAIAAVDGVDGIFVGPADLSADMGFPGNPGAPEVQEAIAHICARTAAAGKILGTITFDPADVPGLMDQGFRFIGVGGDIALFGQAARGLAKQAKSAIGK